MDQKHEEAIENFCAIVGNWDIESAISYLSNNNWDVSAASSEYLGMQGPGVPVPVRNDPVPEAPPGFFSKVRSFFGGVFNALPSFGSFFSQTRENSFANHLQSLNAPVSPKPSALSLEQVFNFAGERNKLVLVYAHHVEIPDAFLVNVLCNREIVMIINEHFVFWACFANTDEGSDAVARFSNENSMMFAVVDPQTSETLDVLERLPEKKELMMFLARFIPAQTSNSDVQLIQDRLIREQQEKELIEAEKILRNKTENQKIKQEIERKEKEEAEYLEKKKLEAEIEKKNKIGNEPQPGPGVSQITFRLPNGDKVERRFNNDTAAEVLYLFIETHKRVKVELFSGYPAVLIKEGNLESLGLTPRGLLHVRFVST